MKKIQTKKIAGVLALIMGVIMMTPITVMAYQVVPFEGGETIGGGGTTSQGAAKEDFVGPPAPTDATSGDTATGPIAPPAAASSGSVQSNLENVFSIQDKDFSLTTVVGDKNKNLLNNLPKAKDENTFNDLYGSVAKLMLAVATIGIFVALFVAGAIMAINQGDENATKTAKEIVKYVIVGVIIIAAAYGIVTGITRLKPF